MRKSADRSPLFLAKIVHYWHKNYEENGEARRVSIENSIRGTIARNEGNLIGIYWSFPHRRNNSDLLYIFFTFADAVFFAPDEEDLIVSPEEVAERIKRELESLPPVSVVDMHRLYRIQEISYT